jgi:hypothetical protein
VKGGLEVSSDAGLSIESDELDPEYFCANSGSLIVAQYTNESLVAEFSFFRFWESLYGNY